MVERIFDPNDRRVRKVRVLAKGENFVQENFAFSQNWLSQIPARITPEQENQVTAALSILIQIIGKAGSS
jgi:DNA-binding MarR family transcriptional regulator